MGCLCDKMAGPDQVLSPMCIGRLWIFEDLSQEELKGITQDAFRKRYSAGEHLFLQGDGAHEMFLIKGGRVKLSKVLEDGNEITLDIRKAGDFVGENMLGEEADYPVSAWSMETTLVCGFTKPGFEDLVTKYPRIGLQVIRNLSKRITYLTGRIGSMAHASLEDRLYEMMLHVAREHGDRTSKGLSIPFPLTHEDLSFLVGAHRVSVTKAMKDLKESGRIVQEKRRFIVMDAPSPS